MEHSSPPSPSLDPVSEVDRARQNTMPERGRPTLLEDLPEEIIDRILIRLPSKDVGRCRAVSALWRSVTSTPEFMLEHHRRQPSLPIVDGRGRPNSLVVLRDTGAGTSSEQLWPFLPSDKDCSQNRLRGACDGFLIVSQGSLFTSRFYIYNPVIRKHVLLPQPQVGKAFYNNIIGLYQYYPTGEYRVLWVSRSLCLSKSSLHVLTVGSDEPRHVTVTVPAVSRTSVEHTLLVRLSWSSYSSLPVHHRGSLHWCPYGASDITGGGGDIIVFDTEAESFRWMRTPTKPCHYRKLFSMNGMLVFWAAGEGSKGFTIMDVWVMQDYEAEIWVLKCRIDVSMVEGSRQHYLSSSKEKKKKKTAVDSIVHWFSDMAMLNERELLIRFNGNRVLRYDIDGKFLGIVKIGKSQYCMELTQHCLQESIIPIPAHEMQGEDEEPLLSTGHV